MWCVFSTRSCTNTDNIPGPLSVFLLGVEPTPELLRPAELEKAVSPSANLYPKRSSIISLRIIDLRQDFVSEVRNKLLGEMP